MSIFILPDLKVRIEQLEGERAPSPFPLSNGFNDEGQYPILGVYSPSETGECWLILGNDRDEIWFISNRHCRLIQD